MHCQHLRNTLVGLLLAHLAAACTPISTTTSATKTPMPDVTTYAMVRSIPMEHEMGTYALAPDGNSLILTPKRYDPNTAYDFYVYDLETGESRKIVAEKEFRQELESGSVTLPLRASGSAAAVAIVDSDTFYANWPTKLIEVSTTSGEIASHIHLGNASGGSNMQFNRMTLTEDGSIDRDMALGGGRSLAVISATKAASGNSPDEYDKVTIAVAGEPEPMCVIDPLGQPTYLDASPDGELIAAVLWIKETNSMAVKIWSATDCSEVNAWEMGEDKITQVTWLPDSSTIATNGFGEVKFWHASTGEMLHTLETNEEKPMISLISRDGRRLVTLSPWSDKEVRVFDAS